MQDLVDATIQEVDIDNIAQEVELVFMATPSGVAMKLAPKFIERGVKVIDLSGDHRLKHQEVYQSWYGLEPADHHFLEKAVYGLSEWVSTDWSDIDLIANPGCFPTSALLGLIPLVQQDLIDEHSIIIDAKTGVSGAGKGLSEATHFAETNDNLQIYKVNQHQHTPEIEQELQTYHHAMGRITFSTHLVPMTRGVMSTIYATAKNEISESALIHLIKESYQEDYFIRIREKGLLPSTKEVYGSNFCDIGVTYDERTQRIMVVSVIDNLVKGASGQAVQNMNKLMGIDEKTGIDNMPIFP